ncbi:MAG: TolC family protein [Tepidisphaerales bacterium]
MAPLNLATSVVFREYICCLLAVLGIAGCAAPAWQPAERPALAPATQPSASLALDSTQIKPMYRELLAIDLPTVVRVAAARNLDIEQARQRVGASRGRYEASVEMIVPIVAPALIYQHLEGVNQSANGVPAAANFDNFLPAVSVQWILNPGRVVSDIVASKRRMEASEQQQESTVLETTRLAAVQYYELALAQARLGVARQAVNEADELVRITSVRVRAGAGLPADDLRARAALAAQQQDLAVALFNFYQASVALTLTLHLDPVVTLVPEAGQITQTTLVREDMPVEDLLATALRCRPDLEAVRTLVRAARADTSSTAWGGLGPQLQAGYSYGGLATNTSAGNFSLNQQQKASAGIGLALDASTFGRLKTAGANERLAALDVERQVDQVRAAVVSAQQASATNARLVPVAAQQLGSAEEALRLAQANLQAGTMLTLDVLQAQLAVDDARLRYADAVVHYNQSQVNLLGAVGALDARHLFPTAAPTSLPAGGR